MKHFCIINKNDKYGTGRYEVIRKNNRKNKEEEYIDLFKQYKRDTLV